MLIGAEAVDKYLEMTDCKCFIVYNASRKTVPIFKYELEGGNPTCRERFKTWAANTQEYAEPVQYLITIYPKGKPKAKAGLAPGEENASPRDAYQESFYLRSPYGNQLPAVNGFAGIGYGANPNVPVFVAGTTKTADELKEEWTKDLELKDLREKVSGIEQAQINLFNRLGMAIPLITEFMTGRKPVNEPMNPRRPAAPNMAGNHETYEQQQIDKERIQASLQKFFKAGLTLEEFESLADAFSKNPEKVRGAINLLKGFM